MKKIALILALAFCFAAMMPLFLVHAERHIPVTVGGKTLDGLLIENTTFVPFDYFCEAMGATRITWDPKTDIVSAACRGMTVSSRDWSRFIEANGRCFDTGLACRSIGGMLYTPIRPLAKAFDADVLWNGESYSVTVIDHGGKCLSGDRVYPEGAVTWLSRIIYAEANTEPMEGKLAVGNVILNRVASEEFPDTIYGVIFDRKYGVQFTPVANGSIYNASNDECRRAAMLVLEGYTVNADALYFMNVSTAKNPWVKNNREYLFSIGEHSFFA